MFKLQLGREYERILDFIKQTFRAKNKETAVIGLSGGLDSALVAYLTIAVLGRRRTRLINLPYWKQTQSEIRQMKLLESTLNKPSSKINIKKIVDEFMNRVDVNRESAGNIMARVRMTILFNASSLSEGLVLGTGNKSEILLGYYTLYGDSACALAPIAHLYKTQVYDLARYIGIPKEIIDLPPSAGLWKGQTDEKELGATYGKIDEILYTIENSSLKENKVFENNLFNQIVDRVNNNKFKTIPALTL